MTQEDIKLIVEWFAHIEQMADDRKTANGVVMEDWAALDEIKCKAKNCQEYINLHCKQPSLPSNLDEGAREAAEIEKSGYNRALKAVKEKVDELYDGADLGLSEYDSGLFNGITETCMKLRGFIKARLYLEPEED